MIDIKMTEIKIETYKFPCGMTIDGSGIVEKVFFELNQIIKKGEKLALFSSGNYEMELKAETDGVVVEIMIKENQKVYQNDDLWKIKTTHNNV